MQPVCPSVGEWQNLVSGEISDLDAGALEAHLSACDACRGLLPGLQSEDPLWQALQRKSPLLPAEEELVEGLIHRVKHLLQSSAATPALSDQQCDDFGRFSEFLSAGKDCRLGQHRLVRLLGSGGMGLVFEAVDEALKRRVALKIMAPKLAASTAARQRFLREARAVAALKHPNIVHIHQVGDDEGAPFFVMEFLEGETLAERLRKTPRPTPQESAAIGRQIAEGLAAAHAQGLIHRDIKPANIFLEKDDAGNRQVQQVPADLILDQPSELRVKILDFGLVRQADEDTRLTRVGDVLGTPAYMSPEQARGEHIDLRADLFSLGCLLYELGTGFTPFQAINSTALLLPTVVEWPKPPHELNPDLPKPLCQLIVHLLSKEPEHRPDSAQQVAVILHALAQGFESTIASSPGLRPVIVPITDPGKKWRFWRKTLTAAFLVMLVGGVSWWFIHGSFFNAPGLSGSWNQAPPLAQPRTNAMSVELDGRLYLLGGVITEKHLDTLAVLHPATGIWNVLAPMPQTDEGDNGRSAASAGVIDGKIYLAGGWRHNPPLPSKTLLIYDPRRNEWDVGPPMPSLSGQSVAGVIGRKFYVLIGSNGYDGIRHLFYVYDPDQRTWKELRPAPRPHFHAAGGVIGDKLYVVGGNNQQGPSGGLDVYDPTAEVWTSLSPMDTPREAPAAAVFNGKLVVLGGSPGHPPSLASIEAYDPRTDRWSRLPDLPKGRHGATAAVVGSTLYILGGYPLESNSDSVVFFTLSTNSR